ncbi:MAG: UPF0104 family protein [Gammaproteobacteria bacterium]|nr:UPF0104 family protein [Gammaproteobacteria bacterium]
MRGRTSKLKRYEPWIAAVAFLVAAALVYRALREYSVDEILRAIDAISARHIGFAVLFTIGSFLSLSGFDTLAVRYAGRSLPYRKIALVSFTALSIGHVLGLAALSSGAVRYRFYTRWGLSGGDVGRIVVFCGVTVAVGIMTSAGVAGLARSRLVAELFHVPRALVVAIAAALLAAVAAYLTLAARRQKAVRIRRFELPVPSLELAAGQVLLGTADFFMVSAVLHQMLSASADVEYLPIAAAYITANAAGIAAHVPGGLGVIEAVVLSLVPGAEVVGALVAFRAVYYLVPFALGAAAFGAAELLHRRRR